MNLTGNTRHRVELVRHGLFRAPTHLVVLQVEYHNHKSTSPRMLRWRDAQVEDLVELERLEKKNAR